MDWRAANERANRSMIRTFGEPATLPGGIAVRGVFDPTGTSSTPWSKPLPSEEGRNVRLSDQHSPVLTLLESEVASVVEGSTVTARGVDYLVSRVINNKDGLVYVMLMQNPASLFNPPAGEKWR